ncbi:MAG TPA: hypothetical protein VEA99_13245 [Gemmatimonadaceae bacterium]|nr:hypothetical protein [Gemmatimonadaceae bacterium]
MLRIDILLAAVRRARLHLMTSVLAALLLWPAASAPAQLAVEQRAAAAPRPGADRADAATGATLAAVDRRSVLRGAAVGAVVGGAIAAGAIFILSQSSDRDFGVEGIYYSIAVPIGIGVGALLGALVGAAQ